MTTRYRFRYSNMASKLIILLFSAAILCCGGGSDGDGSDDGDHVQPTPRIVCTDATPPTPGTSFYLDPVHGSNENPGTLESVRPGLYITAVNGNFGTKGLQALDMQVDRARADGTAAGQRNFGTAEPSHQGTQHEYGSTHRLDQLIGCNHAFHFRRICFYRKFFIHLQFHSQLPEQPHGSGDIMEMGDVADVEYFFRQ